MLCLIAMQKFCPKCHILLIKFSVQPSIMLCFNSIKYSMTNTSTNTAKNGWENIIHNKTPAMDVKVIIFSK